MKKLSRLYLDGFPAVFFILAVVMLISCSSGSSTDETITNPGTDSNTMILNGVPAWTEPATLLRNSVSLNGAWTFIPEGYSPREVRVPGFWEAIAVWPEYESFPEYLAGTPDETLDMIEGINWAKKTIHKGTYLKDIEIPDNETVVKISFESINHKADIYLNDQFIGTHTGPYLKATFDVSKAAIKGTNRLRVELTDGSAIMGKNGRTLWPSGYYAMTDITGLYRPVSMQILPKIHISDTFIVPSVRRKDLTIEHTLVNTLDADKTVWVLSRATKPDGTVAIESTPLKIMIPARSSIKAVIVENWDNPELWSPVNPYLYTLKTLIFDEAGTPIDLRSDRFGFREVWIEDGHYMLNGMRMNLLGENVDDQAARSRYWGMKYFSCENARDTLQRIKDLNINTIRFHQAPPEECIYDMADEMGILLICESPVYARLDITPPLNWSNEYLKNSISWIDGYVKAQRNHPSIVMWSLENEMFLYIFDMSLCQIDKLQDPAKASDTIKRPDGISTAPRPVNWDGDSIYLRLLGYKPETINWHYPCLYGAIFTIEPVKEWYDDAITHFRPFLIKEVPCGVGETMVVRSRDWTKMSPDQPKVMQGMAVRAMRILGFSDMRPYKMNWAWHDFDPQGREHPTWPFYHSLYTQKQKDNLVNHIRQSYYPIAVFDYEFSRVKSNADGTFGPVELKPSKNIRRRLEILNDSFMPGTPQVVSWNVREETTGEIIASGSFETSVPHGFKVEQEISFKTPPANSPQELSLNIACHMEGLPQGDYSKTYRFTVKP
jgi:hypothetical protein